MSRIDGIFLGSMMAFGGFLSFFFFFTSYLRHDTPRHIFSWDTEQEYIGWLYIWGYTG
jgi:hypothetical protein